MKALPVVAAALLALTGCAGTPPTGPAAETSAPSSTVAPAPPADTMTPAQRNASKKAESYLALSAFSRAGLIEQLKFEKYSTEDATWAVDHVTADWNEQAAKKAQSYLQNGSFSRASLVDQLTFEGFTPEQAEHGATQAGL